MRATLVLLAVACLAVLTSADCTLPDGQDFALLAPSVDVTLSAKEGPTAVVVTGAACTGRTEGSVYTCECTSADGFGIDATLAADAPPIISIEAKSATIGGRFSSNVTVTADSIDVNGYTARKGKEPFLSLTANAIGVQDSDLYRLTSTGRTESATFQISNSHVMGIIDGYRTPSGVINVFLINNFKAVTVSGITAAADPHLWSKDNNEVLHVIGSIAITTSDTADQKTVRVDGWGSAVHPQGLVTVKAKDNTNVQITNLHTRWIPCASVAGRGTVTVSNVVTSNAQENMSPDQTCYLFAQGAITYRDFTAAEHLDAPQHMCFITLDGRYSGTSISLAEMAIPNILINFMDAAGSDTKVELSSVRFNAFFPHFTVTAGEYSTDSVVFEVYGKLRLTLTAVVQEHPIPSKYYLPPLWDTEHDFHVKNDLLIFGRHWESSIEIALDGNSKIISGLVARDLMTIGQKMMEGQDTCPWLWLDIWKSGLENFDCHASQATHHVIKDSVLSGNNTVMGEMGDFVYTHNRVRSGSHVFTAFNKPASMNVCVDPMYGSSVWQSAAGATYDVTPKDWESNKHISQLPKPAIPNVSHFMSKGLAGSRLPLDTARDAHLLGNNTMMDLHPGFPGVSMQSSIGRTTMDVKFDTAETYKVHKPTLGTDNKLTFAGFDTVNVFSRTSYLMQGSLLEIDEIMDATLAGPVVVVYEFNAEGENTHQRRTVGVVGNAFECTGGMVSQAGASCVAHVILPNASPGDKVPQNAISITATSFLFTSHIPGAHIHTLDVGAYHVVLNGGRYGAISTHTFALERGNKEHRVSAYGVIWERVFQIKGDDVTPATADLDIVSIGNLFRDCTVEKDQWDVTYVPADRKPSPSDTTKLVFIGRGHATIRQSQGLDAVVPENELASVSSIHVLHDTEIEGFPGSYLYVIPVKDTKRVRFLAFGGYMNRGGQAKEIDPYIMTKTVGSVTTFSAAYSAGYLLVPADTKFSYVVLGKGVTVLGVDVDGEGITNRGRLLFAHRVHAKLVTSDGAVIHDFKADESFFHGTSTLGIDTNAAAYHIAKKNAVVMSYGTHGSNPATGDYLPILAEETSHFSEYQSTHAASYLLTNDHCFSERCFVNITDVGDCAPQPLYFSCNEALDTPNNAGVEAPGRMELANGFYSLWARNFDKNARPVDPPSPSGLEPWEIAVITVDGVVLFALILLVVFFVCARDKFEKVFCCCCKKKPGEVPLGSFN